MVLLTVSAVTFTNNCERGGMKEPKWRQEVLSRERERQFSIMSAQSAEAIYSGWLNDAVDARLVVWRVHGKQAGRAGGGFPSRRLRKV